MMNFKKILREELDGDFDWAKEITNDYWDYFDSVEFETHISYKDFKDFINNTLFSKEVKNWQDWDSTEIKDTHNYLNYLIQKGDSACVTFTKEKNLIVSTKKYIEQEVSTDVIENPKIVKYTDLVKKLDESVDDFDWVKDSRLTLQDIFDSAKRGEASFEVGDEFTLMGNLAGSAEFSPVRWTKPFKITIQSVGKTLEDSKFKIAVKEKEAVYNMEITLDPEKWPDGHVFKDIQFVPEDENLLVMSQKVAFPEEEWIIEDSKENDLDWIKDVEPRLPLKIGTCLTFKQYEEEEDWVEDEYGNMVDHGKMDWHIIGEFIDEYNDKKPTFKMVATDRMGEGRELWMEVEKVKELYDRGVYQPCKKQTYLKRIMKEEINDFNWVDSQSDRPLHNVTFKVKGYPETLYTIKDSGLRSSVKIKWMTNVGSMMDGDWSDGVEEESTYMRDAVNKFFKIGEWIPTEGSITESSDLDWIKDVEPNLFIENDILVFDLPVSREELYDYIIMALKSEKVNDEFTKIWMESLEKDGVNAREISKMIENQEDGRVPYLHIQFGSELYYGSFEGNIIQSVKNRAAGLGSSYVFYSQLIGNEEEQINEDEIGVDVEKKIEPNQDFIDIIHQNYGNIAAIARHLEMSEKGIQKRIKRMGLKDEVEKAREKERSDFKKTIYDFGGDISLMVKHYDSKPDTIRNKIRSWGFTDDLNKAKEQQELEKIEKLKNIIQKHEGDYGLIAQDLNLVRRTVVDNIKKLGLRDFLEKVVREKNIKELKDIINKFDGDVRSITNFMNIEKRTLIDKIRKYGLESLIVSEKDTYEDKFTELGFEKIDKGGKESIIHDLPQKSYSLVDEIKKPNTNYEKIAKIIITNITNYIEKAKDIIKFDLVASKDLKNVEGNVVIPAGGKVEVKDIVTSDHYFSEFLASAVKKSEFNVVNTDYEKIYSNVIEKIHSWLSKEESGIKIKNKIIELLLKDLKGIIIGKNIYVPHEGDNIEFYLSNIGRNNPEKHLRIAVRYNINLGNYKNFYRIGDGLWEIEPSVKSEKGVLYPLTDKELIKPKEKQIYESKTIKYSDFNKKINNEWRNRQKTLG